MLLNPYQRTKSVRKKCANVYDVHNCRNEVKELGAGPRVAAEKQRVVTFKGLNGSGVCGGNPEELLALLRRWCQVRHLEHIAFWVIRFKFCHFCK